jgi:hypothetical protein
VKLVRFSSLLCEKPNPVRKTSKVNSTKLEK